MQFRLLGPVEVFHGGAPLDLGGPRQRATLATLALHAGRVVSIAALTDAIWETAPVSPASNIRTFVVGLRRLLREPGEKAGRLVTRPAGYLLATRPDDEVDVATFAALAERGAAAADDGDHAAAVGALERAAGMWRGDPLEGTPAGPELRIEAMLLQERRLSVQERCARSWIALGEHHRAADALRGLVARYPLREALWALLMTALRQAGRPAEALDAFQEARRTLVAELGVEPGADLQRLHRSILVDDAAPPSPARPAPDRTAPPTAGPDDDAGTGPGDEGGMDPVARGTLPLDGADFVGRDAELDRLIGTAREAAERNRPATVVIAGMAGVGKTRLAVRVAHEIVGAGRFDEITLQADLGGFVPDRAPTDPRRVLAGFLRLLGVSGRAVPRDLEAMSALFQERTRGRRTLLLLDDAASAEQVRPLLPAGPATLVLVTSRRTLSGLAGSGMSTGTLTLAPMSTPEAVSLLSRVATGRRVPAEPVAAERIVAHCDRLPLAVTLAAGRLRDRPRATLAGLADRLEAAGPDGPDEPAAGVRAAFELSYRGVPAPQRRLLRLLSLVPGREFTAGAAAALAGTAPERAAALLAQLRDEHLVQQPAAGRYRLHDLVRGFARERSEAEDGAAPRRAALTRLLSWYLAATHAADRALDPLRIPFFRLPPRSTAHPPVFADRAEALAWLEAERPNLVAAVTMAGAQRLEPLDQLAWRLASSLMGFFHLRSHWDDWVTTHHVALAAARRRNHRLAEGVALNGLGVVVSELGRYPEALEHLRNALIIFRDLRRPDRGWILNNLGVLHCDLHRHLEARDCFAAAVRLFHRSGDRRGEGIGLSNLGDAHRALGARDDAAEWFRQALAVQDAAGDAGGRRYTHYAIGDLHRDDGDMEEAIRSYRRALAINRTLGDRWGIAWVQDRIGHALTELGRDDEADAAWRAALSIFTEIGDPRAAEVRAKMRQPAARA